MRIGREDTLRAIYAAFKARDPAAMAAHLSPEFEFHSATGARLGRTGPYLGHAGLNDYFADVGRLWTELRLSVQRFEHSGSETLGIGRVWARNDEVVIDSPTGWLWSFGEENDLPVRCRVFEDLMLARAEFDAVGHSRRGYPKQP